MPYALHGCELAMMSVTVRQGPVGKSYTWFWRNLISLFSYPKDDYC